jgi:hypothetical protein
LKNCGANSRGIILSGIDEKKFNSLSPEEIRRQALAAKQQAGRPFILTPGCSVPDDTTTASVRRLRIAI